MYLKFLLELFSRYCLFFYHRYQIIVIRDKENRGRYRVNYKDIRTVMPLREIEWRMLN